jgi:hypothetical protein
MRQRVDWAAELGADAVRTTAGMLHDGIEPRRRRPLRRRVYGCTLAEYAVPRGVYPCYENHYKDRLWTREDFSFQTERFLQVFERLSSRRLCV